MVVVLYGRSADAPGSSRRGCRFVRRNVRYPLWRDLVTRSEFRRQSLDFLPRHQVTRHSPLQLPSACSSGRRYGRWISRQTKVTAGSRGPRLPCRLIKAKAHHARHGAEKRRPVALYIDRLAKSRSTCRGCGPGEAVPARMRRGRQLATGSHQHRPSSNWSPHGRDDSGQ